MIFYLLLLAKGMVVFIISEEPLSMIPCPITYCEFSHDWCTSASGLRSYSCVKDTHTVTHISSISLTKSSQDSRCSDGCLATHKIPRASTVGNLNGAKELGNWRVNLVNSAALCLGM